MIDGKKNSAIIRDFLFFLCGSIVVYFFSAKFDMLEKFIAFSHKHETWELDEIFIVSIFLMICFALYSFRLWQESFRKSIRLEEQTKQLELSLQNNSTLNQHLLKVKNEWERTFNSFTDIVTLQDAELNIVKANRAAYKALSFPVNEIIGKHCYEIFHGSNSPCQDCPLLLTKETFKSYSREIHHEKQGKTFLVSATPVLNEQGELDYIAHVAKDITAWKQAEEQLLLSEKMTSIAGLAAGVAHEINTPLSGILQSIYILDMGLDPNLHKNKEAAAAHGVDLSSVQAYFKDQEFDFFMGGIKSSAITASKIIKKLLDFSTPQKGHFSTISLNQLIHKALDLAQSDYEQRKTYDMNNVTIIEEYDADLPEVACISSEIEQVILNLIKNSAQAITETAPQEKPYITLRTTRRDNSAVIEVEDNGPGITEDAKTHIFDPFFTTKAVGSGTGLGLSISRTIIVGKHKGKIGVESDPGQGAKFTIELPLIQAGRS